MRQSLMTEALMTEALIAVCCLLLASCEPGTPVAAQTLNTTECSAGVYGVAAYDELLEPTVEAGHSALYWNEDISSLLEPEFVAVLLARIETATAEDPSGLGTVQRIVLQNDVWGFAQRLGPIAAGSPDANRLRSAALTLIDRLALPPDELSALEVDGPPPVLQLHYPELDWVEVDTEFPVMAHERNFGLRRIFRLFNRGRERIMMSQLVAIDTDGNPHLTIVMGEIEHLTAGPTDSDAIESARVFELDRRSIRCVGPDAQLREVDRVERIPGLGANRYFMELEEPALLIDLPCQECHHDSSAAALPRADTEPAERRRALLEQLDAMVW